MWKGLQLLFLCILPLLLLWLIVCCTRSRRTAQETRNKCQSSNQPSQRVVNLSAVCNGNDGSIKVTWSLSPPHILKNYVVSYRKFFDSTTSRKISFLQGITLTHEHNIEPLNSYEIKVWPSDCETASSSVLVYVDWYCKFPGCERNRRRREEKSYSAFCGPKHAAVFGQNYCLFPECTQKASHGHFCSESHLKKAQREGVCGLVKLDKESVQYEKLKRKFSKSWCSKKGNLPKISHVVEIINPKLQQRLDQYVSKLPWPYNGVEQYYHGTQIKCDMLQYHEPCSKSNCGVCGISKQGFDPGRINRSSWQRFGKGFYFAPNSSKSYDYPRATHDSTNIETSKHHCMLVCDIAPGRKYTVYKNEPSISGPPSGYHSIYGSSRWLWGLWRSPDMNFYELVVFDSEAIRPSYILFLEST